MKERNTEPKREKIIVQQRKAFTPLQINQSIQNIFKNYIFKYSKDKFVTGFTLIELLIVMVVIGVLVAMTYPRFKGFHIKAKLKEVPNIVEIVRVAEQRYYSKHGHYFSFGLNIPDGPLPGEPETGHRDYADGENALFIVIPKGNDAFCDYNARAAYNATLRPIYLRINFWKKGEFGPANRFYWWQWYCDYSTAPPAVTISTHKDGNHEYAPYIEADVIH